MSNLFRNSIVAGVLSIAGVLGVAADSAEAQGFYGPGYGGYNYGGLNIGLGFGGYRYSGLGYGAPGYGYRYGAPGYGYGLTIPRSYYYSRTTTTTIVYCNRCGGYHSPYAPCGGGFGGYVPGRFPY